MFFISPWVIFLAVGIGTILYLDKKLIEESKKFAPYIIVIIELMIFIVLQFAIYPYFISNLYYVRYLDGLTKLYLVAEWLVILSVILYILWGIQIKLFYQLTYKNCFKLAFIPEILPTMIMIIFLVFTSSGWLGF